MANLREFSKDNYGKGSAVITESELRIGCLQRIADATEKMAVGYVQLTNDLDWYKRRYSEAREEIAQLTRTRQALRGAITKLKNRK